MKRTYGGIQCCGVGTELFGRLLLLRTVRFKFKTFFYKNCWSFLLWIWIIWAHIYIRNFENWRPSIKADTLMTLLLGSMWRNCRPFPSIWLNFTSQSFAIASSVTYTEICQKLNSVKCELRLSSATLKEAYKLLFFIFYYTPTSPILKLKSWRMKKFQPVVRSYQEIRGKNCRQNVKKGKLFYE